jgi:hypothetical protein
MGFDFKKILAVAAPLLTSALPGPLGGIANSAISAALGLKQGATVEDISSAINNGQLTGDQMVALKEAELKFQEDMKKFDLDDVEKIAALNAADRDSARKREAAVKDWTPRILAYIYTAGFLCTLGAEIAIGVKGLAIDPLVSKSIDILLGVLTGMVLGTKEYYFGSSAGSDKKTDLLAAQPPKE